MTNSEIVAGVTVSRTRIKSLSPQHNKVSSTKTKQNLNLKKQKERQLPVTTFP